MGTSSGIRMLKLKEYIEQHPGTTQAEILQHVQGYSEIKRPDWTVGRDIRQLRQAGIAVTSRRAGRRQHFVYHIEKEEPLK